MLVLWTEVAVYHSHLWAASNEQFERGIISAGSVSSNLLDDETSGARITLRMVTHTRLTARQKFSWCATGINLKFKTWMMRKGKYNKNQKKNTWKWKAWERLESKNSPVFNPCGSPITMMDFSLSWLDPLLSTAARKCLGVGKFTQWVPWTPEVFSLASGEEHQSE